MSKLYRIYVGSPNNTHRFSLNNKHDIREKISYELGEATLIWSEGVWHTKYEESLIIETIENDILSLKDVVFGLGEELKQLLGQNCVLITTQEIIATTI